MTVMGSFFLQFAFPFPPSIFPSSLLKVLPLSTMLTPNDSILLSAQNYQYEEVWGMDNKDFYEGSNELVHVVKCSGIYPGF